MSYNYREGARRVKQILNSSCKVIATDRLPSENRFTFENSYESWVTAVFVDIRDSTTLFHNKNKVDVAKIVRSFTSETIEILKSHDTYEEIGIRGDCVYAIYNTPKKRNIYEIQELTVQVNTLIKMINMLLIRKNLKEIKVGIGMASAKELVIKAGRKNTGVNSRVWIGNAVTTASKLSSIAGKGIYQELLYNETAYKNFYDKVKKNNGEAVSKWYTYIQNQSNPFYMASLFNIDFNNFINIEL